MNTRKRKVLDLARKLFIEKGFHETSVMDIIHEANISKGTFYNYFTSKNECLIAILQESREEASIRRHEMIFGQDPKDIHILSKQISVIMHINREHNLLPIFESIIHSPDKALKKVVWQHNLQELKWLSTRLIEVYGEEISTISYECAVQVLAMIQHTLHTLSIAEERCIEPESVVKMALRNIDAIIPRMLETKEVIINSDTIDFIESSFEHKKIDKEQIIQQLSGFLDGLSNNDPEDGTQYATSILKELLQEKSNLYVIQALLKPFRQAFSNTTHAAEAREIANYVWRLIEFNNICIKK